jgi:anti-sigma factor RsiW
MMQCRDTEELLIDFLYEELDQPRRAELEAHVNGCSRCTAEVASMQRTRQAMRALPSLEPSSAVTARLLHEAARNAPKKPSESGGGIIGWLGRLLQPAIAHPAWAAAASLVLVLAVTTALSVSGKISSEALAPKKDDSSERSVAPAAASVPSREVPVADKPASVERRRDVREPGSPPVEEGKVAPPAVASDKRAESTSEVASGAGANSSAGPFEATPAPATKAPPRKAPSKELAKKRTSVELDDIGGATGASAPSGSNEVANAQRQLKQEVAQDRAARSAEMVEAKPKPNLQAAPQAAPPAPAPAAPLVTAAPNRPEENRGPPSANAAAEPPRDQVGTDQEGANQGRKQSQSQSENQRFAADSDEKRAEAPEEQLLVDAQKQAKGGRCGDALTITGKIARLNPAFYKRRVVGDPTIETCTTQQAAPARSKNKMPAVKSRNTDQQRSVETAK